MHDESRCGTARSAKEPVNDCFTIPALVFPNFRTKTKSTFARIVSSKGTPAAFAMIMVWTTRLSFVVARTHVASFFTSPVFRCRMWNVVLYRRTAAQPTAERVVQHLRLQTMRSQTWTIISSHKMREKRIFVCPAHACWTCTQLDLQKQEADASSKQTNRKNGQHNKKRKKKKKKGGSIAFAAKSESKICVSNALLTVHHSDRLRQRWLIDLVHFIPFSCRDDNTAMPRMSHLLPHILHSTYGTIP